MICEQHATMASDVTTIKADIHNMRKAVEEKQDEILTLLRGESGRNGLCSEVQDLKRDSKELFTFLSGDGSNAGVLVRVAKVERAFDRFWAIILGATIVGGGAGVGIFKLLAAAIGG